MASADGVFLPFPRRFYYIHVFFGIALKRKLTEENMYITFNFKPIKAALAIAVTTLLFALPYLTRGVPTAATPTAAPAKTVYLTFDDGPSRYTEEVLAVLDKYDVKATFFVTGQNEDYLPFIGEAHERGHLIALHTYSHSFKEIYSSREAFWEDIGKLQEVIVTQTGSESNMLRFAGGSSNTICRRYAGGKLMRELVEDCEQRGISYHDWNIDTKDAVSGTLSANTLASRIVKGVKDKEPAVVLMHDGTMAASAADALDIAIPQLLDMGCDFARLDEITAAVHHTMP